MICVCIAHSNKLTAYIIKCQTSLDTVNYLVTTTGGYTHKSGQFSLKKMDGQVQHPIRPNMCPTPMSSSNPHVLYNYKWLTQ